MHQVGILFSERQDPVRTANTFCEIFVKGVYQGSPADRSGVITEGDTLLEVNGENVRGLSLAQVAPMITGPLNTPVQLGFKPGKEARDLGWSFLPPYPLFSRTDCEFLGRGGRGLLHGGPGPLVAEPGRGGGDRDDGPRAAAAERRRRLRPAETVQRGASRPALPPSHTRRRGRPESGGSTASTRRHGLPSVSLINSIHSFTVRGRNRSPAVRTPPFSRKCLARGGSAQRPRSARSSLCARSLRRLPRRADRAYAISSSF
jgi:hypothetical protein